MTHTNFTVQIAGEGFVVQDLEVAALWSRMGAKVTAETVSVS